jgi:hypothetical protein
MVDNEEYPEYITDLTEPHPVELVEGNIATLSEDEPYMWHVELYLVSKYQPEFAEATIWKLYSAAKERAKIVKEHAGVYSSLSDLQNAMLGDFSQHVQFNPGNPSHRAKYAGSPGIGRDYQRELQEL